MRYHACFFVFYLPFCRVMLEDDSTGASAQGVSRLHLLYALLMLTNTQTFQRSEFKWFVFLCLTRRRKKRSRDVGWCAASQNVTTTRFHCLVYTSEISFPDSYLNETILTKKAARTKRKEWEAVQETQLLLEEVISLYNVNGFVFKENTWIYTLAKRMNSLTVRELSVDKPKDQSEQRLTSSLTNENSK